MSGLERTSIGQFHADTAVSPDELNSDNLTEFLQPATHAVNDLPGHQLSDDEWEEIRHGRVIRGEFAGEEVAALDTAGRLVAILRPRGDQSWGPKMVFVD